jgi:N-acetylglutamate synthase-like GNAT family acetyltransferase
MSGHDLLGASTAMSLEVRPYRDGDAEGLVALVLNIQQGEFGISITYSDQPDLQDVAGFFRNGAGEFWVAADDIDVVGCVGLVDLGNHEAALRKMFVRADHRGGERGVAQQLLVMLLSHARRRGITKVYLGTTEKFRAAHRFYEKNGFALVPEGNLPPHFPRMALDTRFYAIDLSQS